MAKEFHHLSGGKMIDDLTINSWIDKMIDAFREGKTHWSMSCGDTSVIMMSWTSEMEILVANDSGRSRIRFSLSKGHEDELTFSPYVRPVVVAS